MTHLETYLSQTLGNTIKQLKIVILLAVTISISILILITSLFMKMLFAKDSIQIAIMKSIGFTIRDIRIQYLVRILLIAGFGIIVGVKAASIIGQNQVQLLGSMLGASKIQLESNPLSTYILLPIVVMMIIAMTTLVSTLFMNKFSISEQIAK